MVVARQKQLDTNFIPIEVIIETEKELKDILQALNYGRRGGWPRTRNYF